MLYLNKFRRTTLLDTPNSDQSRPKLLIELPQHNLSCTSLSETFDTDEIMAHSLETDYSISNDTTVSKYEKIRSCFEKIK